MRAGDIDSVREPAERYGTLVDGSGTSTVPTLAGRWRGYYENVADVLLNGAEPVVKPAEMRRVISVIDAAFRSGESGEVVRLGS